VISRAGVIGHKGAHQQNARNDEEHQRQHRKTQPKDVQQIPASEATGAVHAADGEEANETHEEEQTQHSVDADLGSMDVIVCLNNNNGTSWMPLCS